MTAGKPRTRAFRITRGLAVEMMDVFSMAELLSFMAKLVHGQIRANTRYKIWYSYQVVLVPYEYCLLH